MSTYKFCGGKCPQCPPGSTAYGVDYAGALIFKYSQNRFHTEFAINAFFAVDKCITIEY